ncbi:MAG: peptidylprolyl isomerase [Saprospiraceae bacterium]|nr:peptidylprolyl isomerase [Saprospiraceae bacterium]MBK7810907.1 peptidylprolyl isomerase [Saprospiraceae bacterium]MBK9630510.1 peptidylprolyl isomerase [Saprospiraceae bacterium]
MIRFLLNLSLVLIVMSCGQKKSDELVIIETSFGTMKAKLYDSTPKHKANFIKLIKSNYYDDLLFHRVMQGFMIQGGDPESKNAPQGAMLGSGGPGYTIDAEIGKFHFKGALCAARQSDAVNPEKKSSGSQFYIVQGQPTDAAQIQMMNATKGIKYTQEDFNKYAQLGGAPFLDGDYTVFGEVVEGMEVIDKIAAAQTLPGDRPVADIKMKVRLGQ